MIPNCDLDHCATRSLKNTRISRICNSVTHLRSYTNYAIAGITGNSALGADIAAPSITNIVASNGESLNISWCSTMFYECFRCFMIFYNVSQACFSWCLTKFYNVYSVTPQLEWLNKHQHSPITALGSAQLPITTGIVDSATWIGDNAVKVIPC